ncbi:hypothetical protein TNCV_431471 [Trichonephila clavipes]|nr:hypothetical protein TNCV_431471 [Trichonephila clavipes]
MPVENAVVRFWGWAALTSSVGLYPECMDTSDAQTGEIKEKRNNVLSVGCIAGSRCLATIQNDASQLGKALFAIVPTSRMGDFAYAKKANVGYMFGSANGNGRVAL